MTNFQFWTYLGAPSDVVHDTLETLRDETFRQTGEDRGPPYYLYFRGDRYGVEEHPGFDIIRPPETREVTISSAQPAPGDDEPDLIDEWTEIENVGQSDIQLFEWSLVVNRTPIYSFPAAVLSAGQNVTVHTGTGADTSKDLFMNRTKSYWQKGEVLYLIDENKMYVSSIMMD